MQDLSNTVEQDPILTVTPSAADRIRELLAREESSEGRTLRVFVEGGGCSGMQYGLVFDEPRADDITLRFHGVSVLIDPFSANYLRGSVVDFKDELNEGGFKVSNPNARQTCGCGKSFEA